MIRTLPLLVLCPLMVTSSSVAAAEAAPAARPNVIVVLADDLGWTDLGCYGSAFYESPNIDRLAREGMRFTSSYSACTVCSPTRAALLTGDYPARLRVTDWIPGLPPENPKLIVPDFTAHLPHEAQTLAELLREAGYATASIGKWHLGDAEFYPESHGFDLNIAGTDSPQPRPGYFAPYDISTIEQGPAGEYITRRLGQEAEEFIRQHADQPFLLYLAHFAVHLPIQAERPLIARFERKVASNSSHTNAAYAAMIYSMDETVARIRKALDELDVSDRTIIIFTSDNGGRIPTTSNAPLRAGKGSCYEGGVRVPLIVYWPGQTHAGAESDAPVMTIDLLPTILEMTGLRHAGRARCDGVSLASLINESGRPPARSLFWHYPHYQHYQLQGTTPYGAIRRGDHKLIEFYSDHQVELYDLRNDIGESNNLAASEPALAQSMQDELHAWLRSVDAQMPTPNPQYNRSRPEHTPRRPAGKARPPGGTP